MQLSNNKILITGGASGIGLGLAERFLKEGNQVIICGRRAEALEEAAAKLPGVITRQVDLTLESDRVELYKWVAAEHPDVNVLINNAGIQNWMKVTDEDFFTKAKLEINTNIEAPLHLTSLFLQLPALKAIMNITSGLAFVPAVRMPVYSATKAFMSSFTQSLQVLLAAKNIEVIEVVPPALNTDLGGKGIHDRFPPVSDFIDGIFAQLREGRKQLTFGFTESVTKAGQEVFQPIFTAINELN